MQTNAVEPSIQTYAPKQWNGFTEKANTAIKATNLWRPSANLEANNVRATEVLLFFLDFRTVKLAHLCAMGKHHRTIMVVVA